MSETIDRLQSALADRYVIEREIGSGGMATVYLARDLRHKREVALKVLKPELGAVLGTERFLSEITVTANLQHPNLLPLFDSGEAGGLLFYVMPFVRGETLRDKIDREKQLSVDEAVRIAVAVASALQYAHEHGVIHRDLKPENILLQSGVPVIADFGIALAVQNAGGTRVTQTGLSLGTPQYMSPEQATGDREIGPRSDIYSLGAVTYEMLSGEPPHSGNSAQAIIAKLMTSEPQPLNTLRSTIPVNVACAVEKALAKLPADRFASAKDFADALQNPHFTIGTRYGRSAEQSAAAKRWKKFAAAAFATAVVFIALALWALLRPAPPKQVIRYALEMDSTDMITGSLARLAVAPDGSKFVYCVSGARLMVRSRDQLRGTLLAGVEQAYSPFLSRDGSKLGYVGPPSDLHVISLNGGPPIKISDSVAAPGGAFGADGSIYITALRGHGIARISDAPGAPLHRITRVDSASGELVHVWPDLLPDGKSFLFSINYASPKPSAIAAGDLSTGKYHIVVNGMRARFSPSGHILYATSDGSLMIAKFDQKTLQIVGEPNAVATGLRVTNVAADFQVTDDGTLFYVTGSARGGDAELIWIERDGKITPVDPSWRSQVATPALSPDGRRVAVSIGDATTADIWVKQLDRGPALKLTTEGTRALYPEWTPDGTSVTYSSNTKGPVDLWTKRADGSAQATLQLHMTRDLSIGSWSHDGKWLIARTSVNAEGSGDIFAMRPGTDTAPMQLVATKNAEVSAALSPDGRWLAYVSNETGGREVYVVPFPDVGKAKWPISIRGGSEPLWSHSGRELFYRTIEGLMSVPVTTSPTFSAGAPKLLFKDVDYAHNSNHRGYDISPDDKRFIYVRTVGPTGADRLVVVENWFEDLKGKSK